MSDIDVWPYALAMSKAWVTAKGRISVRRGFVVQIGESFGDAAPMPGARNGELATIHEQLLRPRTTGRFHPNGPARHALLQAGLCDRARLAGMSLGALLGERDGRTPRSIVLTNATIPILSTAATVRQAKAEIKKGCRTIKLKVSGRPGEIRRVAHVRDAIGPHIALRLDPNGAWDIKTALDRLERLEGLAIQYVEQPIKPGRPNTFLELAGRSPIPIAPDEDVSSLASLQTLLAENVLEFVVLKPMLLGGPDLAMDAIIAVEEAGAIPVVTDVVESGIGRAGALHVASLTKDATVSHGLASGTFLRTDLVDPPLVPRRATLRTPSRPGLGVKVWRMNR